MANERSHIPAVLSSLVRQRAREICEYCHLPQSSQEATFHIDHIVPCAAGGATTADNLALACVSCSLRKAARRTVRDARTGTRVPLYHPRTDRWVDHFAWTSSWQLKGKTATGRVTIVALKMNRPTIVAIRNLLATIGKFPPRHRAPK